MSEQPIERPRLRPSVDVMPIEQKGQRMFLLYDAAGLAEGNLGITGGAFALVALMTGELTLDEILDAFEQSYGQRPSAGQLVELLNQLDRSGMLDGPLFEARYARLVREYRDGPFRPSQAIDGGPTPEQLRSELSALIAEAETRTDGTHVVGLFAPHLDYDRGRPCYAQAYAQLRGQEPFDRYVILGANHFGRSRTAVWTTKDYGTPIDRAETDRAFLEKLQEAIGSPLDRYELDHLREHSVELQVTLLQSLFGADNVRVVPILCPDVCGPTGTKPAEGDGPDLAEVADAIRSVIDAMPGSTCVIAGADLSHIGRRFGDECDLDKDFLAKVEAEDRKSLERIEAGDADGFMRRLQETENMHRMCSSGCIYTLLKLLDGSQVRMLHYHQAVNPEEDTGVTCAAAVLTRDAAKGSPDPSVR